MEILRFKEIDPRITKNTHIKKIRDHIEERKIQSELLLKEPQVFNEACLVCGSTKNQIEIYRAQNFPWIYCPKCTHKYKKHMPDYSRTLDQIRNHSVELYLEELEFEYRMDKITKPKYEFMMRYFNKQPGRWLDLATGIGDLPYLLCQKGWNVDATEINRSHAKAATKRLPFKPKEMTLFEYFESFTRENIQDFDVVGTFGYFDMLVDPVEHAKTINKMLRMGGLMGINLPRSESLTGAMAELWPDTSLRAIPIINYSHFSEKSLFYMLEKSGFEPLGILRHGLDIHELVIRLIEHAPGFGESQAANIIYELFNDLQKVIDQADKSDLMLVCAQKIREV